jgi:hypothetical protein
VVTFQRDADGGASSPDVTDALRTARRRGSARVAAIAVAVVMLVAVAVSIAVPGYRDAVVYRFKSHTGQPPVTRFEPFAHDDQPLVRLAAAGDVGTGGPEEWQTAEAMDQLEGDDDYDALLLLGDNVYPDGDPADLPRAVFDPFGAVLDGETQLLAVLGNHDVEDGYGDPQAAALGMPNRWYSTEIGDALLVALDSTRPHDAEQLAWLEETLSATDATWKIVMLHHPPYSGGAHGSSVDVRDAFAPLFERYGVQLVLAGHDHDYQRSTPIDGVTYVVSGGASKLRPAHRADFMEVAWSVYHFTDIAIWSDRLQLRAMDQSGAVFDSVILFAPGNP